MNRKTRNLLSCAVAASLALPAFAVASPAISGGVWFNYRNVNDDDRDDETGGDIADEALVLYVDDKKDGRPWSFSAETRFGPGSFTDPNNNSTGDNFTIHKAWVGYQLDNGGQFKIGKSQVPFGWKTVNFWPGDILLGGYGDQMDVGVKYSGASDKLSYDLAYYHADDWGETSTDTVDDNGHWGSSTTYRKVQTVVGNLDFEVAPGQIVGVSGQSGGLQDLTTAPYEVSGSHSAWNIHYHGSFDDLYAKAQYITVVRDIPNAANDVENWRAAAELGYTASDWFYYLDTSTAESDTDGNSADSVMAHALGARYSYGPGWIYLEYLTQDGWIGADGDVGEGDFDAFYASIDYYF